MAGIIMAAAAAYHVIWHRRNISIVCAKKAGENINISVASGIISWRRNGVSAVACGAASSSSVINNVENNQLMAGDGVDDSVG